jgi:hypothetical protein
MLELMSYCKEDSNDADHCQARVMRNFILASLLGAVVGSGYTSDDKMHTFICC